MLSPALVISASLGYLLILFAVAYWADWRGRQGRLVIANPWVYALSLAVYCTAWTYFGSVGRAASGGLWFLPIYLGPTLAMALGWAVLRKMVRIARTYRITTIADFIGSPYGKSPALAGLVTSAAPEIGSQHAGPLRDGLRSLQLAFREASPFPDAPGAGPGEKFTGPVYS